MINMADSCQSDCECGESGAWIDADTKCMCPSCGVEREYVFDKRTGIYDIHYIRPNILLYFMRYIRNKDIVVLGKNNI